MWRKYSFGWNGRENLKKSYDKGKLSMEELEQEISYTNTSISSIETTLNKQILIYNAKKIHTLLIIQQ